MKIWAVTNFDILFDPYNVEFWYYIYFFFLQLIQETCLIVSKIQMFSNTRMGDWIFKSLASLRWPIAVSESVYVRRRSSVEHFEHF